MWADRSAALGGGLTCGEGIAVGGEVGPGPVAAAIACGRAGVQQGDSGGQVAGAGHRAGAAVHQPWFDQAEPVGSPEEMDPSITLVCRTHDRLTTANTGEGSC